LNDVYDNGILKKIFFSFYLGLIFLSTFVSIALPIERAIGYFNVVAVAMGILTLSSLAGITYFLAHRGLFPPEQSCDLDPNTNRIVCVQIEDTEYFSTLCLAGIIMLTVYMLPFVMRPLDFLSNFKSYVLGFTAYMLMMPVFTNVFQIYAMCNLHDVSWGNRPTSTGQEAFTDNKNDKAKAEGDYKVFRTNFVLCWLAFNVGYYIMI